jgi:hypothetical protein
MGCLKKLTESRGRKFCNIFTFKQTLLKKSKLAQYAYGSHCKLGWS